jgi:hypothetical protein
MNVSDDHALKTEIDEIAKRIDNIIKIVNQYHPEEPNETISNSTEQVVSE